MVEINVYYWRGPVYMSIASQITNVLPGYSPGSSLALNGTIVDPNIGGSKQAVYAPNISGAFPIDDGSVTLSSSFLGSTNWLNWNGGSDTPQAIFLSLDTTPSGFANAMVVGPKSEVILTVIFKNYSQ